MTAVRKLWPWRAFTRSANSRPSAAWVAGVSFPPARSRYTRGRASIFEVRASAKISTSFARNRSASDFGTSLSASFAIRWDSSAGQASAGRGPDTRAARARAMTTRGRVIKRSIDPHGLRLERHFAVLESHPEIHGHRVLLLEQAAPLL